MKEIIYIQAGPLANHIGTHFWNTQQCYFSYDDGDEVLVDHDVSFREGLSPSVSMDLVSGLCRDRRFRLLGRGHLLSEGDDP